MLTWLRKVQSCQYAACKVAGHWDKMGVVKEADDKVHVLTGKLLLSVLLVSLAATTSDAGAVSLECPLATSLIRIPPCLIINQLPNGMQTGSIQSPSGGSRLLTVVPPIGPDWGFSKFAPRKFKCACVPCSLCSGRAEKAIWSWGFPEISGRSVFFWACMYDVRTEVVECVVRLERCQSTGISTPPDSKSRSLSGGTDRIGLFWGTCGSVMIRRRFGE